MTEPPIHDLFTIVEHKNINEFIKDVNRYTKIGWELRGDIKIDSGKYVQVLTIKSNVIVWETD